ncbi:hypothetical protein EJ04DRAFT_557952 [Polyplosphaeria fusca]|uniref:Heterokaryon incompatibility domain-containing protein n=1 Tax=Polyplosphaeria fusca TaxID=682080 RepID=A0A9P4RDL3_9PLEO|nr:hypothetical protein EJ04DRAFT_557952 [Polyplosphaeria fusca]
MTSLERRKGNRYGDTKEPDYGILTYTWGRWEQQDGPRVRITGTTWRIPAISTEHFSIESFENVIEQMGKDSQYVWIDVACIDQEDEVVKMEEVNNQVAIFANAQRVYVWFSRLSTATLQNVFDDMFTCSAHLQRQDETALGKSVKMALNDVHRSLTVLLNDPWFSSLWTLQEGTLRGDALILSREGSLLPHPDNLGQNIFLGALLRAFWHIRSASLWIFRHGATAHKPIALQIANLIREAGYEHPPFARNPNIQYGAAHCRKTSRPLDRIFAIMSIYGIRMVLPTETITLNDLEHEFAMKMNQLSPRLGQMFIHTEKPQNNETWKITQRSRVTAELAFWSNQHLDSCSISASSLGADFEGPSCTLEILLAVWKARMGPPPGDNNKYYLCHVRLDDYIYDENPHLPRVDIVPKVDAWEERDRFLQLAEALPSTFHTNEIIILKLGEQRTALISKAGIGLVLLRAKCTVQPESFVYRRLGLCQWALAVRNGVQDPTWQHIRGTIY